MNSYIGQELDLFAEATNWKRYWASKILPYLRGDILEVGAGLGANTAFIKSRRASSWTCIEPDPALVSRLRSRFMAQPCLSDCHIENGTTETLGHNRQFDAIVYIDVLEHIEADREELARASSLLRKRGTIIALAPAHQWLYTSFDSAIGHFRRYNKSSLSSCSPPGCDVVKLHYLDSAGMLASMGNRFCLRQSMPGMRQIMFWDRFLVPITEWLDPLTLYTIGKSILVIWRRA